MNTAIFKQWFFKTLGYVLILGWVIFTFVLIGWVIFASFSTSAEIFSENMFKFRSGFHFENYVKAWNTQRVSVFFLNSFIYTMVSCTAIIIISSPAAYALSRYRFRGNAFIQNMFAAALGIPVIMIIMPLFSLATVFRVINNRFLIMFLYTNMNIPFAVFFLTAFFRNLSFPMKNQLRLTAVRR
jgi:N-acetylglucosamine transport system permease protein